MVPNSLGLQWKGCHSGDIPGGAVDPSEKALGVDNDGMTACLIGSSIGSN